MRKMLLLALPAIACAVLLTPAARATELSGWQKGCAYKMPSGAPQSNAAMVQMYCPMLTGCQSMMDQGRTEMMAPMACFGFSSSVRKT